MRRRFPAQQGIHTFVPVRPREDTLWVDDSFWDVPLEERLTRVADAAEAGGHAGSPDADASAAFVTAGSSPTLCLYVADLKHTPISLTALAHEVATTVRAAVKTVVKSVGRRVVSWLPAPMASQVKSLGRSLLASSWFSSVADAAVTDGDGDGEGDDEGDYGGSGGEEDGAEDGDDHHAAIAGAAAGGRARRLAPLPAVSDADVAAARATLRKLQVAASRDAACDFEMVDPERHIAAVSRSQRSRAMLLRPSPCALPLCRS